MKLTEINSRSFITPVQRVEAKKKFLVGITTYLKLISNSFNMSEKCSNTDQKIKLIKENIKNEKNFLSFNFKNLALRVAGYVDSLISGFTF